MSRPSKTAASNSPSSRNRSKGGARGADPPRALLFAGLAEAGRVLATSEMIKEDEKEKGLLGKAFENGPALLVPRYACATAALGPQKMLVIGGFDEDGLPLDSTEIVDFKSNDVIPGPKLREARAGCAAIALPLPFIASSQANTGAESPAASKRRVPASKRAANVVEEVEHLSWIMVMGGYGLDTTEIIDAETMTTWIGPCLKHGVRACFAAVMIDSCRLLIAGGFNRFGGCTDTTEICEILPPRGASEEFLETWWCRQEGGIPTSPDDMWKAHFSNGPKTVDRRASMAAAVFNYQSSSVWDKLELQGKVELEEGVLSKPIDLEPRRCLLLAGGVDSAGNRLASTELLDVGQVKEDWSMNSVGAEAKWEFKQGPDLLFPRSGCVALLLDDLRLLIAGGMAGARPTEGDKVQGPPLEELPLAETEYLNLINVKFTEGPSLAVSARAYCAGGKC